MIKGSVKITFLAACMALLPVLAVDAQTYDSLIRENHDRAAGVLHYYEYSQSHRTKAPKGFKPFYISHYGRHGSRYHTGARHMAKGMEGMRAAWEAGLLTEEGKLLKRQMDTLDSEHEGMYGMLSERGGAEHRGIGGRMYKEFKRVFTDPDRQEVECVSSYWPRCLVSMANFTSQLKSGAPGLQMHYVTGPKYLDYISMDLDTKEIGKEGNRIADQLRESLLDPGRFFKAIFTDPEAAARLIPDKYAFIDAVFCAGAISPNTVGRPDIFKHFTVEELEALWIARNEKLYYSFGISREAGDYSSAIAKPLIEDIVAKADAALEEGSHRAADLRFGHDVGLLPLIGTLGIEGMDERYESRTVHEHWNSFEFMCMASNIQMVFYRNRKGEVLVKVLYNEKETTIPALGTSAGPYYRWQDMREYLLGLVAAIPEDNLVMDRDKTEKTGVS